MRVNLGREPSMAALRFLRLP
ncbi:hypothetical protein MexAM1_META1p2225 [Methylorubrum extorquens AM1]|uniref:Uncharacterized protein n=1 Tax=Methylorubrum extorquens (strain ATCC 14718 / DSM 1338 / JCM 2805 / NCIMB 9133 / AM1) TaxID=272630 RepID=C5APY3_METEA|nr:hypothetical protein MexAM1_META1p2225 [Methylorubrum extorquens AM1]